MIFIFCKRKLLCKKSINIWFAKHYIIFSNSIVCTFRHESSCQWTLIDTRRTTSKYAVRIPIALEPPMNQVIMHEYNSRSHSRVLGTYTAFFEICSLDVSFRFWRFPVFQFISRASVFKCKYVHEYTSVGYLINIHKVLVFRLSSFDVVVCGISSAFYITDVLFHVYVFFIFIWKRVLSAYYLRCLGFDLNVIFPTAISTLYITRHTRRYWILGW